MKATSRLPGLFALIVMACVAMVCSDGGRFVATSAGWVHAEVGTHQLLLPPEPLDPIDFTTPSPAYMTSSRYHLPSGETVDWYRLWGWTRLAKRHAIGGGFSYVGIHDEEFTQFGSGPPWIQLSSHIGPLGQWGSALDLNVIIPLGDGALYPVSALAPSVTIRYRFAPLAGENWHVWLGWYARRVSPPSSSVNSGDDARPPSDFPSGSGLFATAHGASRHWMWYLMARYDMAGYPEAFWYQADLSWYPTGDIGITAGASAVVGPEANRAMDWGWTVGISFRLGSADGEAPSPTSQPGMGGAAPSPPALGG